MLKSHKTYATSQIHVIQEPEERKRASLKFPKDDERKERQWTFSNILRFGKVLSKIRNDQVKIWSL